LEGCGKAGKLLGLSPKRIHLSIGKFSKDLESSLPPAKSLLICSASSPAAIVAADVGKSTKASVKWKG
jgi:hypothetical protein